MPVQSNSSEISAPAKPFQGCESSPSSSHPSLAKAAILAVGKCRFMHQAQEKMDTSAWKTEAICDNSRAGREPEPWRVEPPRADLNKVPFFCVPSAPQRPAPGASRGFVPVEFCIPEGPLRDLCSTAHTSPSPQIHHHTGPLLLPELPSLGLSRLCQRQSCCFSPPAAVGQCQKSSSGAPTEISPGITAPRGDKLDRSKYRSCPSGLCWDKEFFTLFLAQSPCGGTSKLLKAERSLLWSLQGINVPFMDQVRPEEGKQPRSFDRELPHLIAVGGWELDWIPVVLSTRKSCGSSATITGGIHFQQECFNPNLLQKG